MSKNKKEEIKKFFEENKSITSKDNILKSLLLENYSDEEQLEEINTAIMSVFDEIDNVRKDSVILLGAVYKYTGQLNAITEFDDDKFAGAEEYCKDIMNHIEEIKNNLERNTITLETLYSSVGLLASTNLITDTNNEFGNFDIDEE